MNSNNSIVCILLIVICAIINNVESIQWIKNAMYQEGDQCNGEIMSASYQVSGSCANGSARMYCNDDGNNITISYYGKMGCKGPIKETDPVPVNNCTYGQEVFSCITKPQVPASNAFLIYRTANYCGDDWSSHIVTIDYTMMNQCIYDSQGGAFSYSCTQNNQVVRKQYTSANSCTGTFKLETVKFNNCSTADSYPYYTFCK